MIASLVVTLDPESPAVSDTLHRIATRDEIETGELADGFRLPVLVETRGKSAMADTTRWIQEQQAVVCIDVVFVHFEQEPANPDSSPAGQT